MIKLYKLTFNTEIPFIDEAYDLLTEIEKQRIHSFNILSSFYYNDRNFYMGFLLISDREMRDYEIILNNNLIPYLCEDYTQLVIENEINLETKLEEYTDIHSYPDFDDFIFKLNKWILENLEVDSILDRINEYGINSLRPIDKEYLRGV